MQRYAGHSLDMPVRFLCAKTTTANNLKLSRPILSDVCMNAVQYNNAEI